jgi:hypothetical protein
MFMGLGMPIPDLSNKPGPGRPGFPTGGSYDFQFEVTGAVTIKANAAAAGTFRISWPNGNVVQYSGNNASITAPDATAGIVSINNEELDTTYVDEFAVVGGQTNVAKVVSWGQNPWNRLASAFRYCTNLTDISKTSLITDGIGACDNMLQGCTSLLEVDAKNWQLTAGWKAPYFIEGCTNLTKVDMTGLSMKLGRSDNWMQNVGTNVTDGCEFLMSGISFLSGTYGSYQPYWFRSSKIKHTSTFASWSWDNSISDWYGINMFDNTDVTGVDSILNVSGWTTFPGTTLQGFIRSVNYTNGVTNNNLTIDLTGLNVSNVTSFSTFSQSSDVYKIKGISGWGATAGNVTMHRMFENNSFLKIPALDNFSDTFIQSLTPTDLYAAFQNVGKNLLESDLEASVNLNGFDVSNCNSFTNTWMNYHSDNSLDFSNVTFGSTAHNFTRTWSGAYADESNSTLNFPNQLVVSIFSASFQNARYDNITFGNNVDFSQVTSVNNMLASQKTGVNITFPTAASGLSFASLTSAGNWFAGTTGPTTGPLTTCQIDNLIRSFRATAYGNALNVSFYQGKITGTPSVVRTLEAELVANGWTITENSTDATMPFVYTTPITQGVDQTPTGSFTGGTFSSSDAGNIPVNAATGEIDATNAGNVTIRYTITATGCYNEQALVVEAAGIANNYSMSFDGASSYIDTGSSTVGQLQVMSVSAWFEETQNAATNTTLVANNGSTNKGWAIWVDGSKIRWQVADGTGSVSWTETVLQNFRTFAPLNQWNHICCTFDGSYSKIYINGVLKETWDATPTPYVVDYSGNVGNLIIGRRSYSNAGFFRGKVDEVAIWNTALTSTQIQSIYNAASTNLTKDLTTVSGSNLKYWNRMGD